MLKELLEHLDAFGFKGKNLGKFLLKKTQPNFVEEYLDIYYPGQYMVPVSVLNPLYDILGKQGGVSLSYGSKNFTKIGLVRYRQKNMGSLFIAGPSLLIEKSKVLNLDPKFCYTDLVAHLIKTKSIQPILDFYKEDIKSYV